MIKVITYGTYDLLHYGHIRLLERAKALGDYLIVGITSDDYDKTRGKINIQQSLMERVEAVRQTGLADEIVIEEYEGQKIDDIKSFGVDIFTVGSDWIGYFDYLKEYCQVVYLERTEGVSSSDIRSARRKIRLGFVGNSDIILKFRKECECVNGLEVTAVCSSNKNITSNFSDNCFITDDYDALLNYVDAVNIISLPQEHYGHIKKAINAGKHVLCEAPLTLSSNECKELFSLAKEKRVVLFDSLKTAYATAYRRLLLQIKSGKIGEVYAIDATCTSLRDFNETQWNSMCSWGPTVLLPMFDLLGKNYKSKIIISHMCDNSNDLFTRLSFVYDHAVATLNVGQGVKSEGSLIVSGTKGYAYVPAPWWKTDYFELRYENPANNRRFFYQLDGEGIRYELVAFLKTIEKNICFDYVNEAISEAICEIMEDFYSKKDFVEI